LKNEDLDQLPDDPDDLQAIFRLWLVPQRDRTAPSSSWTASVAVSCAKESIREIRINSNPFSQNSIARVSAQSRS